MCLGEKAGFRHSQWRPPPASTAHQELDERLPQGLKDAVIRAGKEAGLYGGELESGSDDERLVTLEKAGKLKRIPFADRAGMKKLVDPVMAAYAKEIDALAVYEKINAA